MRPNRVDLFAEIETAYRGGQSVFDNITKDDLIMAFFPCIYFTGSTETLVILLSKSKELSESGRIKEKFDEECWKEAREKRNDFYKLLYKMVGTCIFRKIRIVIENPFSSLHYLHNNFLKEPSFIDRNRRLRGDYFTKPTRILVFNSKEPIGKVLE